MRSLIVVAAFVWICGLLGCGAAESNSTQSAQEDISKSMSTGGPTADPKLPKGAGASGAVQPPGNKSPKFRLSGG